jgi:hypothetical protein
MRTPIVLLLTLLTWTNLSAQKMTAPQLINLAQSHSPALQAAIAATFPPEELKAGTAWAGNGHDFFFALQSTTTPQLFIDNVPGPRMQSREPNLAAASTSPHSVPIPISNPVCRPASSRKRSYTPAKSMTA